MKSETKKYDLEDRTAEFGKKIIRFCKKFPMNIITQPLINQIIRSGTSVGANYMEANGGSSRRDFRNKIFICKKEIQETKHWLRMFAEAEPNQKINCLEIWKEAQELTLIFSKILSSLRY